MKSIAGPDFGYYPSRWQCLGIGRSDIILPSPDQLPLGSRISDLMLLSFGSQTRLVEHQRQIRKLAESWRANLAGDGIDLAKPTTHQTPARSLHHRVELANQ